MIWVCSKLQGKATPNPLVHHDLIPNGHELAADAVDPLSDTPTWRLTYRF